MQFILKYSLLPLFLIIANCSACLNKFLGIKAGILPNKYDQNYVYSNYFGTKDGYAIGLKAEYAPKKAFFSVSGDAQYVINLNRFIVPLAFNIRLGKHIKFRLTAGLLPMIDSMKRNALNSQLTTGIQLGVGLEIPIYHKISLIGEWGLYTMPFNKYDTSPGGLVGEEKISAGFVYFNLGIQRDFGRSE